MSALRLPIAGALLILTLAVPSASAGPRGCGDDIEPTSSTTTFVAHGTAATCSPPPATTSTTSDESSHGAGEWKTAPVCESTPPAADPDVPDAGGCVGQRVCPDGSAMVYIWFQPVRGDPIGGHNGCASELESLEDPGPTQADILRAFRRIPLPESVLIIQPPGGATLVNFDTNFYTEAAPFERTVRLLGHRVAFRISTQSFTWHFGDHTTKTTTQPGAAYPALDVTHRYLTKGTVAPRVDTTWQADYQLDDRPWAPVNGTVTMQGDTQQLTIKSATPILVG